MSIYPTTFDSDNLQLGPCYVYWNGAHVGHIKGGVSVSITQSAYELKSDNYGDTPLKSVDAGVAIEVTVNLAEITFNNLKMLSASAEDETTYLTFGKPIGGAIITGELLIEPQDGSPIIQIYKAAANLGSAVELSYTADNQRVIACKFKGLIDDSRTEGDQLFRLGGYSSP